MGLRLLTIACVLLTCFVCGQLATAADISISQQRLSCHGALQGALSDLHKKERVLQFLRSREQLTLLRLAWGVLQQNSSQVSITNARALESRIRELIAEYYTTAMRDQLQRGFFREWEQTPYQGYRTTTNINALLLQQRAWLTGQQPLGGSNVQVEHYLLRESDLKFLDLLSVAISDISVLLPSNSIPSHSTNFRARITSHLNRQIALTTQEIINFWREFALPRACRTRIHCANCSDGYQLGTALRGTDEVFQAVITNDRTNDMARIYRQTYVDFALNLDRSALQRNVVNLNDPETLLDRYFRRLPERSEAVARAAFQTLRRDAVLVQVWAQAAARNQNYFRYRRQLYETNSGQAINPAFMLQQNHPRVWRQEANPRNVVIRPYARGTDFLLQMALAMGNGDLGFSFSDNAGSARLMRYDGNSWQELRDIQALIRAELAGRGITSYTPSGMGATHDRLRALALLNNNMFFVAPDGYSFDAISNRAIDGDFTAGDIPSGLSRNGSSHMTDSKPERRERTMLNRLNDEQLIIEWHQRYGNARGAQCEQGNYSVVDKVNKKMRVYHNDGNLLWEVDIITGNRAGDERTRWRDRRNHVTNLTTGAGVYNILEQRKTSRYHRSLYRGDIYALARADGDETPVLAVHRTPVGMIGREQSLRDGRPSNNSMSNGCINMLAENFTLYKQLAGSGCRFYVLPENNLESVHSRFRIEDGDIRLHVYIRPSNASEAVRNHRRLSDYEVMPDAEYRPIQLELIENAGLLSPNQATVIREYLRTLRDQKQQMMQAYGLSNDDYNDLAQVAFAILGTESEFGQSDRYIAKLALDNISGESGTFMLRQLLRPHHNDNDRAVSHGLTQIKEFPQRYIRFYTVRTGQAPTDLRTLRNPQEAALATMAFLTDALHQLRTQASVNQARDEGCALDNENLLSYIGYYYNGGTDQIAAAHCEATPETNIYSQRLRRYMSMLRLTELTPGDTVLRRIRCVGGECLYEPIDQSATERR